MKHNPLEPQLFPYTTLFRSRQERRQKPTSEDTRGVQMPRRGWEQSSTSAQGVSKMPAPPYRTAAIAGAAKPALPARRSRSERSTAAPNPERPHAAETRTPTIAGAATP